MRNKQKCLDHMDSIERLNKGIRDLIGEYFVTNNPQLLKECANRAESQERFVDYLRNMIEIEDDAPF